MGKFYLRHITIYSYTKNVYDRANQLMLYPVNDPNQQVIRQHIKISENPVIQTHLDAYNNMVGNFSILKLHKTLIIDSESEVHTKKIEFPPDTASAKEQWDFLDARKHEIDFFEFFKIIPFSGTDEIRSLIDAEETYKTTPYQTALKWCDFVYKSFNYTKGVTDVHSTLDQVWRLKAGVCQDFTSILIQILRLTGIPTKYVSGYISSDDDGLRGEDATHAWVEVYIPFYGWLGLDPTNNCIVSDQHIRLCTGRNYTDCSPIKGVYRGNAKEEMLVKVYMGTTKTPLQSPIEFSGKSNTITNSYFHHLEMKQQQQ